MQMAVVSRFTYTLETIIQAGQAPGRHRPTSRSAPTRKLAAEVAAVPLDVGPNVRRNTVSIFPHLYAQYEPLRVFMGLGASCLLRRRR